MKRPTMHPGFPLAFRRSIERKQRRAQFMASLSARDGAVVFALAFVIGVLVLFAGGK